MLVGVAEYVDIPAWRVLGLRAKIDTGARSSALHVEKLREIGGGRVRFDVRLHRSKSERRVTVEATIVRRARVRASTGVATTRIFVAVDLRLGPVARTIELGLVDRQHMLYRMLLGRTALDRDFLVDPSRRFVLTGAKRRASARPPTRRRERISVP